MTYSWVWMTTFDSDLRLIPGLIRKFWMAHLECWRGYFYKIFRWYPNMSGSSGRSHVHTQNKIKIVTVTVAVGSSNCNCVGEEYNLYYIYNVQKVFFSTCKSMIWANLPIHSFMVGCLKLLPPRNECTGCFAPAQINRVLPFYVRNSHCSWLRDAKALIANSISFCGS